MQNTVEYTNGKLSPATIELLIHERNKGKSLRDLGQDFNRSYQRIGKILSEHDMLPVSFLPESKVAAKIGYPVHLIVRLRKEGIIKPRKSGFWLYSEEQVRQIQSLIASARKCEQCGKPRPLLARRFCRECREYRRINWYKLKSPEAKAEHKKITMAWREANPEKWKEIQSMARIKYNAKSKVQ